jgi:hypothetical protein
MMGVSNFFHLASTHFPQRRFKILNDSSYRRHSDFELALPALLPLGSLPVNAPRRAFASNPG